MNSLTTRCTACHATISFSAADMTAALKNLGHWRRGAVAGDELIEQLFLAALSQISCPRCGAERLAPPGQQSPGAIEDDDEEWGGARRCEICRKSISRDRVAALPGVRTCLACQQCDEVSGSRGAAEYCPQCGETLQTRLSRRDGLARYVLACPQCGEL